MERLSVYHDYTQTMPILRAARNRVLNAFDAVAHDELRGRECIRLCGALHAKHLDTGLTRLERLHKAMSSKNACEATSSSNALHRHNRQSAKLSRLFESDITDYHPDPDDFYVGDSDEPITPSTVDAKKPISVEKLLAKLYKESERAERERMRAKAASNE
jgi:hypothetical protein